MPYNIEIIKKAQYKTSKWSGGTTTELYIYPKGSIYSARDFKWRLSSAVVEVEHSIFTPLKGISRLIMIIKGELRLCHEGHHKADLKAYEQDSFNGDWTTTSFGKVTDFNLMLASGCSGRLEYIFLNKDEFKNIILHNNEKFDEKRLKITEAFYLVKGDVEIAVGAKRKIKFNQGDLALVTKTDSDKTSEIMISNNSEEESKIIRATIFYKE
ncbi:HutD/Ves family protein [Clostridium sp.]|uniref:HutD/Ves family protein n=1 Tax=Clostridium sp. TaxID=1506 RepID=UPI003D6D3A2D